MATYDSCCFVKPGSLEGIPPHDLARLLSPHADYFARRGVKLPPEGTQEHFPYQAVAQVLTSPDIAMPEELTRAVYQISELAGGQGFDSSPPRIAEPEKVTLERHELEDGVHWIVGGVDRGVIYKRRDSIKAEILETLFRHLGYGSDWIRHDVFLDRIGWTKDAYFGTSYETGRMQKQLTALRKELGVSIEFRKSKGVKFGDDVVRGR